MNLLLALRIAVRALARNRLRSLLTMLGVIIGVAAVIAMLGVGNGARIAVQERIAAMGTNTIFVFPGSSRRHGRRGGRGTGRELKLADLEAVRSLPEVAAASPELWGSAQVVYGAANWSTSFRGVSPEYFFVRNWTLARGRVFTSAEVAAGSSLAVLGKIPAQKLFGASDPVGETIRIRNVPFRVIGVLAEKGEGGWGGSRDDIVVVPYTTAQRRLLGTDRIAMITASARDPERVAAAQHAILTLLRERHRVPEEDEDAFYCFNQAEISETAGETTRIFTLLLGSIASVSLVVGGIGIMNIMLVSVTERVREIGIRMAVGARGSDILLQFLTEAVVLSVGGGLLGILLGVGAAGALAKYADMPAAVSESSLFLAFGFAVAVGIFFGFYPALQASRMDPIVALRHE